MRGIVKSLLPAAFGVTFGLAVSIGGAPAWSAADIPWKNQTFEGTYFEADVKDVLRVVIEQNDMQVIFRPGVQGEVSGSFSMPLQGAFNKLVEESGLDYEYDDATRMVTVYSSKGGQQSQAFIPLKYAASNEIQAAVRRFGLGGTISIDSATRTVFVKGTSEQVQAVRDLVGRLDDAQGARQQVATARQQAQVATLKAEREKRMLEQILDTDMKVIPLRFASVGKTTKIFHGKELAVPGIEETLNVLMGDITKVTENMSKDQVAQMQEWFPNLAANRPTISADTRTNSVVVRGTPAAVAQVEKLVRELDQPVPMVTIEVMIVKAEDGVSDSFGVNWAGEQTDQGPGNSTNRFSGFNTGISSADPGAVGQGLGSQEGAVEAANSAAGHGDSAVDLGATLAAVPSIGSNTFALGYVLQTSRMALQAQLSALESQNRSQTIASPTLTTLNNVPAKIERTASEYFQVTEADGSATNLKEIDVGLTLDITPSVIPREDTAERELVRMSVSARNTSLGSSTLSQASAAGQEVQTEVIVPEGATFIMGGLFDDTRSETDKGVPMFKDLPIVGPLFGTETGADSLVETIFFITPGVVHPEEILPRDIAERRYLNSRRFGLALGRKEIQKGSKLVENSVLFLEEDE